MRFPEPVTLECFPYYCVRITPDSLSTFHPDNEPSVLDGIRLVKEGKEQDQAIGYTDDGTMVVISEGRQMIGQKKRVVVTSVLQTQAGRMIFAKIK